MANDLARWQFATTTIYHFLFVPVTIGLAFLVAVLQTVWYRTDNPDYKRMTRFFGTLLLINVAIGVVTGLVQEFEFGMNWSIYSRYVGSVFGAPLAMEGLLAFFLESTFLGLWLFGWDRLPKRVHLATIWLVSLGTVLSAMFILMANSWMQHPVGYKIDKSGQAVLTNMWALFVNPTFVWGYAHVILASLVTGCLVMLAVSAWYLRKKKHVESFHRTAKVALIVLIPTIVIQLSVGNQLGVIETHYQPAKIAAAEALWNSCKPCSFSAAQVGGFSSSNETATEIIPIPHLLSVLATGTWSGPVTGLNQLQAQYQKKYGPGNYIPDVFIQYWSIRVMAGLGTLVLLFALWGGWLLHRGRLQSSRLFLWLVDLQGPIAQLEAVPDAVHMGSVHAVPDEHRGLAADRERPSALGRAGAAQDGQRELPLGHHHRPLDQPGRVCARLRRARRRRPRADAALLAPRDGRGRRRSRRRVIR